MGKNIIGREIRIDTNNCIDDDLLDWLEDSNIPLIVTEFDVESYGVWVKECPYRIDMDEFVLV